MEGGRDGEGGGRDRWMERDGWRDGWVRVIGRVDGRDGEGWMDEWRGLMGEGSEGRGGRD